MPIIINLFGSGIRYWVCDVPTEQYEAMDLVRVKHNVDWERVLFDLDFLKHFGYQHWSNLSEHPDRVAFSLNRQNRIEVKQKSKFLAKWTANELDNRATLFPIFTTTMALRDSEPATDKKRLILFQQEKGLVAKYELNKERFDVNQLEFELSELRNELLVSGVKYDGNYLASKSSDTLVTGFSAHEMIL